MRYEPKDYQEIAIEEALGNLRDAAEWARRDTPRVSAFALTAPTGSGKTVMVATCIEALFYGHEKYNFAADPTAVVMWLSGDPKLNLQVRDRFISAADKIPLSRMVVIENTFNAEKFETASVYFLNTQKLGKSSKLTRGHNPDAPQLEMRPDLRSYTIWDTIKNTINDPNRTLYVVLDEAHEAMQSPSKSESEEQATLVSRLINGHAGIPAAPIVFGISATPQRFTEALGNTPGRTMLPVVTVEAERVQRSGLLKDDILLDIPTDDSEADTVLLRRGTERLRDTTEAWSAYTAAEGGREVVVPLMVVQVPNTPSEAMLIDLLDTVTEAYPATSGAIAHVFGEHTPLVVGSYVIPYIEPQLVQDTTRLRVLLAKDAVSTGWDCPRAEVLVSFRRAVDRTHITQIIGRMVRTPLARRIPGDDVLNSVACLLPRFDEDTAMQVVSALTPGGEGNTGESGGGMGRKVIRHGAPMTRNIAVGDDVFEAFGALPSMSLPQRAARPIRRLAILAANLSSDGIRPGAVAESHRQIHALLDGLRQQYKDRLKVAVEDVETISGRTISALEGKEAVDFVELADDRAIESSYKAATRVLGGDLARKYADLLAGADDEDGGDQLREAHITVAALGMIPEVLDAVETEARKIADRWLGDLRVAIKDLGDEREATYNRIRAMSRDPEMQVLIKPKSRNEPVAETDPTTRKTTTLPTRSLHLLSDASGEFPVGSLKGWEIDALDRELDRGGVVGWYRNPSRPIDDALSIPWRDGAGQWRLMQPDILIFTLGASGNIRTSIIDPHSYHLSDALGKLHGLARFVADHGTAFHRVEALAEVDKKMRVLDVTNADVRRAILAANDAKSLYRSEYAANY